MAYLTSYFTRIVKQTMDIVFPITCPECGIMIDSNENPGVFCDQCRGKLADTAEMAVCPICSAFVPSTELLLPEGCYCCGRKNVRLTGMIALGAYHNNERLSKSILTMKHGGKTWYAREFGYQLARKIHSVYPEKSWDTVVSVPLHRSRLWKRGYNQAAIMAAFLAASMNIPAYKWLLHRHRKTPPQSGGRKDRQMNVRGAFNAGGICRNARVILVDDVVTTGATVSECAEQLYNAGATEVLVAACAWVPSCAKKRSDLLEMEEGNECSGAI
jgi:ComF family protein